MHVNTSAARLTDDDRGVAPLVGFILLFGIAVVAFAGYQATTVPDENAEVEFDQYENVRQEMGMLQIALSEASMGENRYESLKLGTQYPDRTLAVNPPPPTGTIETTDPYPVAIKDSNGEYITGDLIDKEEENNAVPTRFLQYIPNYHETDPDPIVYDNGLTYLDAREETGNLIKEKSPNALADDDAITVSTVENEFSRTGIERAGIDFLSRSQTGSDDDDVRHILLPTKVDQGNEDLWEEINDTSAVQSFSITDDYFSSGVNKLNLTVEGEASPITRIGVDGSPDDTIADIEPFSQIKTEELALDEDQRIEVDIRNVGGPTDGFETDLTVENVGTDSKQTGKLSFGETDTVSFSEANDQQLGELSAGTYELVVETPHDNISDEITVTVDVFREVSAGSIESGISSEEQEFSFTLDSALDSDDTVTIDLSDTEGVEYPSGDGQYEIQLNEDEGELTYNKDEERIEYEAAGTEEAGDTIVIGVDQVETVDADPGSYEVKFTHEERGETKTTTFDVLSAPPGESVTIVEGTDEDIIVEDGDVNVNGEDVTIDGNVTAHGGSIAFNEEGVTVNGNLYADHEITVNEESGELDGRALYAGGDLTFNDENGIAEYDNVTVGGDVTLNGEENKIKTEGITVDGSLVLNEEDTAIREIESVESGQISVGEDVRMNGEDSSIDLQDGSTVSVGGNVELNEEETYIDVGSGGDISITEDGDVTLNGEKASVTGSLTLQGDGTVTLNEEDTSIIGDVVLEGSGVVELFGDGAEIDGDVMTEDGAENVLGGKSGVTGEIIERTQ